MKQSSIIPFNDIVIGLCTDVKVPYIRDIFTFNIIHTFLRKHIKHHLTWIISHLKEESKLKKDLKFSKVHHMYSKF